MKVEFLVNGDVAVSYYPYNGEEEIKATTELIAYEKKINEEDIRVILVPNWKEMKRLISENNKIADIKVLRRLDMKIIAHPTAFPNGAMLLKTTKDDSENDYIVLPIKDGLLNYEERDRYTIEELNNIQDFLHGSVVVNLN